MYVPSEPRNDPADASRAPMPWQSGSPPPVRWAGPNLPQGPAAEPREGAAPPTHLPPPQSLREPVPPQSGALLSIGSFVVSVALYAVIFRPQLGLGITILLLVHELGHYVIIRSKGLPASLPVFIPLVGAYVAMRRWPASVRDDAEIALAGPLAGSLSALACVALFQATGSQFYLQLAFLGYALNLLNLVPILPLDGGRAANAVSPLLGPLAFIALVVYAVAANNVLLMVVLVILGLPALVRSLSANRQARFFHILLRERLYIALVYVLLAIILCIGLLATRSQLTVYL